MDLHTEIEIHAPPARVWRVLMDTAAYPEWNPFIKELTGELVEGARFHVRLEPSGGKAMTFRPKVLRVVVNEELRWIGRMGLPGLFSGEHWFRLEPSPAGTRFVHAEHFSGILVPLFRKGLDGATRRGFEEMNRALKRRAEQL